MFMLWSSPAHRLNTGIGLFSAIDAPGGFLFEWWSVFWDIFIARTNEKHSDAAASYIEVIFSNSRPSMLC